MAFYALFYWKRKKELKFGKCSGRPNRPAQWAEPTSHQHRSPAPTLARLAPPHAYRVAAGDRLSWAVAHRPTVPSRCLSEQRPPPFTPPLLHLARSPTAAGAASAAVPLPAAGLRHHRSCSHPPQLRTRLHRRQGEGSGHEPLFFFSSFSRAPAMAELAGARLRAGNPALLPSPSPFARFGSPSGRSRRSALLPSPV
jgi:hypothetical protein